jgi:ADP-ribose pyrophosphatase YjhB (NUDIX family)
MSIEHLTDMHHIQKHILKKLSLSRSAAYSELKPAGIESNKFAYHLRTLINDGLIMQKAVQKAAQRNSQKNSQNSSRISAYSLTPKGKLYVDNVSFESFRPRAQPKMVTLLVIEKKGRRADGGDASYILYRRRRAPFINHIGFPYGKIHLEERLHEAAQRELSEKTGLRCKLVHKGDVYITVHDEMELVSHVFCHVFYGKNPAGTLKTDGPCGECFWARVENIPQRDLIPGVQQILKQVRESKKKSRGGNGGGRFFGEYFLNTTDE